MRAQKADGVFAIVQVGRPRAVPEAIVDADCDVAGGGQRAADFSGAGFVFGATSPAAAMNPHDGWVEGAGGERGR